MRVIEAYNIYQECSEGLLDADWKVAKKDRITFSQLRLKLLEQMPTYDLRNDMCPGDKNSEGVHKCINQDGIQ